jgi:hypothetical protein
LKKRTIPQAFEDLGSFADFAAGFLTDLISFFAIR